MMHKKSVCVLMSTYNGEKYLREQIDSILAQKGDFVVKLLVRDDGSDDSTKDILNEYAGVYKNVSWYEGHNLGSTWSFFALLDQAPEANYYAFSDQDDVWLPNKLEAAINTIGMDKEPVLYSCKKEIVDKNLKKLNRDDAVPEKGLLNALYKQNKASGCTMVFNHSMKQMLSKHRIREKNDFMYHDSWAYKVAELYGKNIYDANKYMLYRQHGNNVVGAIDTGVSRLMKKIANFNIKRSMDSHVAYAYALELSKSVDDSLPSDKARILDCVVNGRTSFIKGMRLACIPGIDITPVWEYIWIKLKMILGWY